MVPQPVAGLVEDPCAVPERRQLGRLRPAPAWKLRGVHSGGVETEVAGGTSRPPRRMVLRAIRHGAAEALLRSFPQGRAEWVGQGAACMAKPAPAIQPGVRTAQG